MRRRVVGAALLLLASPLRAQHAPAPAYACPAREYEKRTYALTADPENFAGTARLRTGRADFHSSRLLGLHEGVELEQATVHGGRPALRLWFVYTARDWIFIQPGESLRFVVNGEMVRLTTGDAQREEPETVAGKVVRERAAYALDAATLRTLATARAGEARVYLYGGKGRREYVMNTAVSCTIARFAAAVLDAPARAAAARPDAGAVVGGRVATTIAVAVPGRGGQIRAAADLPLAIIDAAGRRLTTTTDADGSVTVVLSPGPYRVVTSTPVEWAGRRYRWDFGFTVRPGLPVVDLTPNNAVEDAAPRVGRPRR